jgi:Tol biopolymer transport system component
MALMTKVKLAIGLMVIILLTTACTLVQESLVMPEIACQPPTANNEHLFYAESITYIDPSPLAWDTIEPSEAGLDRTRLEMAAVEAGLSETIASLLVIRHGKLAFERYFNDHDFSHANNLHSLSKSILSVVTGIAITNGLIELDTPIADILPADIVGANGDLAVRHLLTMASGLEIDFELENDYIAQWEAEKRSFVRGVLESRQSSAYGEVFEYLNLLTQVLSAVIAEAAEGSTCDFTNEHLFQPLAIDVEHWHVDPDGYHAGGHSMFLTPREIARFGQMVLQRGVWQGKQLVSAEWLAKSLEVTWELGCRPVPTGYGYLWWLNEAGDYQVWTASGAGGQELHIVPDLDLVMVMTHATDGDPADFEVVPSLELLQRYVIPAIAGAAQPNEASECARPSHIVAINPDGSDRTVLLDASFPIAPWSWSPDGERVVLHTKQDLNYEIYSMAADGSDWQRLTREFAVDIMPAWSPDGATIAFARGDPANSDLYHMNADGSNPTRLTELAGYEHSPTWSPDGQSLAFIHGQGNPMAFGVSGALWVIATNGSEAKRLLDGPVGAPTWSPVGQRIAFESRGENTTSIQVIDLDDGMVVDLGPGSLPRWSPDGTKLVFTSSRGGDLDLFIMDADGNNIHQLTSGASVDTLPLWSPDGKTILYISSDVTAK